MRITFLKNNLVLLRNDIGIPKHGKGKLAVDWKDPFRIAEVLGKSYYKGHCSYWPNSPKSSGPAHLENKSPAELDLTRLPDESRPPHIAELMCRLVGNTAESYNPRGAVRTTQSSSLQIRRNLSTNDKWVITAKSELNKYDGKVI
ncbi:hypothetical protein PIB30_068953 [Stylosanthes scabra]|uniref:Uncharacterized protein n=1 Tax=Stylosanthes scabra TaxID=79078 RepID=A0ABU6RNG3_9FABA|nr:hypothetical protein [Stylosanthes scabra]